LPDSCEQGSGQEGELREIDHISKTLAFPERLAAENEKRMISEEDLGKRIKEIRLSRKMTLAELAEKSDFTKGYLSKLENSEKGPPVSTLMRLAQALDVSISEVFGETEGSDKISLVKKTERRILVRNGTRFGYNYQALAYKFKDRRIDPYLLTRPPHHKRDLAAFKHKGQEMLFMLEGTMEFFHGGKRFILEEGDCIYWDSDIEHWGNNIGDKDVKALLVVYGAESEKTGVIQLTSG